MIMTRQENFNTLDKNIQEEIMLRWIILNYNNLDLSYDSGTIIAYDKETKEKLIELHNIDYSRTCMDVCVGEYIDIILSNIKKLYSIVIKDNTKAYAIVDHYNRNKEFKDFQIREVMLEDFSTILRDSNCNAISYIGNETIAGKFISCVPINKRLKRVYVPIELVFNLKEDAECALNIINQLDNINYTNIKMIGRQCHSDLKESSITNNNNLYIYDKLGNKISTRLGHFKEEIYIKTKVYTSIIYDRVNEIEENLESTYLAIYDSSNELVKQSKDTDIKVLYYQNKYFYKYEDKFVWPIMINSSIIKKK